MKKVKRRSGSVVGAMNLGFRLTDNLPEWSEESDFPAAAFRATGLRSTTRRASLTGQPHRSKQALAAKYFIAMGSSTISPVHEKQNNKTPLNVAGYVAKPLL